MDKKWTDQFTIYFIDPSVMDNMDWALALGSAIGTLFCIAAWIYWLYKLVKQLWLISAGRVSVNDAPFWKRMLLGLILILALMSGVWFLLVEQLLLSMEQSLKGVIV
jgi:hypothetical protein